MIYEELCLGAVRAESRAQYRAIMARLVDQSVEGIILGCTEITLLVSAEDSAVPLAGERLFDEDGVMLPEVVYGWTDITSLSSGLSDRSRWDQPR